MQLNPEFWIQLLVYAITFGVVYGQMKTKMKYMEQKLDKHNNMVERLYKVEASVKSAHKRLDELREDERHL